MNLFSSVDRLPPVAIGFVGLEFLWTHEPTAGIAGDEGVRFTTDQAGEMRSRPVLCEGFQIGKSVEAADMGFEIEL